MWCEVSSVCRLQAAGQAEGGVDQEKQTHVLQGETTETKMTHKLILNCELTLELFVVQLHSWQPGIKNPYRGMVVWPVPENIDISVTLFKVAKPELPVFHYAHTERPAEEKMISAPLGSVVQDLNELQYQ